MTVGSKKFHNFGLWIPERILKMSMLSGDDKLYYAHVYSFGERGCYQTDVQIGKSLGRCARTIQRYQANCKKAGLFKVVGEGSKYRRIWAKDHPKFKASQKMRAEQLRQTCQSRTTNLSELPRQTCPTTNKDTNKRTNKGRGGSPSPAEGQAHAPLSGKQQQLEEYRTKEETVASIQELKKLFGLNARRTPELTAAEREQRRQLILKQIEQMKKQEAKKN